MLIELAEQPRVNMRARDWCRLSYPGHPYGCPNFNYRDTCPPHAPLLHDVFDLSRQCWLVVIAFDLRAHTETMRQKHPDWSERQVRCLLYWQAGVNKQLRGETRRYLWEIPGTIASTCPEAMGMDVISTAQRAGLPITVHPVQTVYKVTLLGYPKAI